MNAGNATLGWAVLGFIVIGLELVTGTFYLLVIGIALLAGALVTWLGLSFELSVALSVILGAGGCAWLRFSGFGKSLAKDDAPSLDAGLPVSVEEWGADGVARVLYRGTQWDAECEPGARRDAPLVVASLRGNRLILKNQ